MVYLFDAPLEVSLINSVMRIPCSEQYPYYKIYEEIGREAVSKRLIQRDDPNISTTEHYFNDYEAVIILVNNKAEASASKFALNADWTITSCLYGTMPKETLVISANDALILKVRKNN